MGENKDKVMKDEIYRAIVSSIKDLIDKRESKDEEMEEKAVMEKDKEMEEEALMAQDLYMAAMKGNKSFLTEKYSYFLSKTTYQGNNIIHVAVRHRRFEFVKAAVETYPELVCGVNRDGDTPFHVAAETRYLKFMLLLITAYTTLEKKQRNTGGIYPWRVQNKEGNTALHIAILHGRVNVAECLVEADPTLARLRNNLRETPLHLAVKLGDNYDIMSTEAAEKLFGFKIQSDPVTSSLPLIRLLLKLGRSVACWRDKVGLTPLLRAATLDPPYKWAIETILDSCPESAEVCDPLGNTILHLLSASRRRLFGRWLIDRPEIAAIKDNWDVNGNTAAHLAVKNHNIDILRVLFSYPANVSIKNAEGVSAGDLIIQQPDDFQDRFRAVEKPRISSYEYDEGEHLKDFANEIKEVEKDEVEGLIKQTLEKLPSLICKIDLNKNNTLLHLIVKEAPHLVNKELLEMLKVYFEKYQEEACIVPLFSNPPWKAMDTGGYTPLHLALSNKKDKPAGIRSAKVILEFNPKLAHQKDLSGRTPLYLLSEVPNEVLQNSNISGDVDFIIKKSQYVEEDKVGRDGLTPFLRAAQLGNTHFVKLLLDRCVRHRDGNNNGFLHLLLADQVRSTSPSGIQVIKQLLTQIQAMIQNNQTQPRLMEMMYLASSSIPHSVNKDGNTPMHLAIAADNFELALILCKLQCPSSSSVRLTDALKQRNKDGKTPFDLAVGKPTSPPDIRIQFIEFAMENSELSVLREVNNEGNTTLHLAALEGDCDLANVFLKLYPSMLEQPNEDGNTPLHLALLKSDENLLETFINDDKTSYIKARYLEMCNHNGDTPLHLAIMKQLFGHAMIMIDIASAARCTSKVMEIRNKKGETPCALIDSAKDHLPNKFKALLWRDPLLAESMLGVRSFGGVSTEIIKEYTNTVGVTAAILATLTFTAAFTVPGGVNTSNGTPLLMRKAMFQVFMVSDILAMCLSMMVLLCLLWVMTVSNKRHQGVLLDLTVTLLQLSLYTTLITFMAGLYVTVFPVIHWIAIVACALCFLLIMLMHKCLIIKLIPPYSQFLLWLRKVFSAVRNMIRRICTCQCLDIANQPPQQTTAQQEAQGAPNKQAVGEHTVLNLTQGHANNDSA